MNNSSNSQGLAASVIPKKGVTLEFNGIQKVMPLNCIKNETVAALFKISGRDIYLYNPSRKSSVKICDAQRGGISDGDKVFVVTKRGPESNSIGSQNTAMQQQCGYPFAGSNVSRQLSPYFDSGSSSATSGNPSIRRINVNKESSVPKKIAVVESKEENKIKVDIKVVNNVETVSVQKRRAISSFTLLLTPAQCTLAFIHSEVMKRVESSFGNVYALFTSKGFMLYDSKATNNAAFWKEEKNFIAVAVSYNDREDGVVTVPNSYSQYEINEWVDKAKKVFPSKIFAAEKMMGLLKCVNVALPCSVCKSVMIYPAFCKTCSRLVGCFSCISQQAESNKTCPQCRGRCTAEDGTSNIVGVFDMNKFGEAVNKWNDFYEKHHP